MRITEKMMTTTYNRNLQKNIANLSNSNLKLSSRRQYNHVSEDPATASKAFAIRTQIAASEEHIRTVENAVGELETADSNITAVHSILDTIYEKATRAGGTTDQASLNAIAEELGGLKDEILQTMNAKYGEKYLFSGSGNDEPPFTLGTDGELLFNGKPVDDYDKNDPDTWFTENKPVYLDVGFGNYADGKANAKSGIQISTSGADVLGYGKDANGLPNNLYSLVGKIEEQLKAGDKEGALDTLSHLKEKQSNASIATSELGTREKLLERTQERLETGLVNLKKRQQSLEGVNLETEAVNNKSYESAWMVTLQLGSSIIPPSIFDFMK
ncbi:hypothetical protein [Clostridium sp. AN503]|uniref:flagellin N-terminal helical domain-containing protein n=1 Tax=Clostridium sp. AN503 TaxID=3160598 RepID=UPI0034576589